MRSPVVVVLVVVLALVALLSGGVVVAVKVRGRREVFDAVRRELARQLEELRPDLTAAQRERAASIIAAQAVMETGGGAAVAWREGWNFGNVTAGASWTGPVVQGGDLEYRPGADKPVRIVQRFRKYATLAAAVSDFLVLLSWSRYRPARDALFRGDAEGYARELRAGGYYTAPLAEYQAGIAAALVGLA